MGKLLHTSKVKIRREPGNSKIKSAEIEGFLDQVAKRNDQQQPGGVADLRHRYDQADERMAGVELAAESFKQRLRIVDVANREAARHCKEKHEPARNSGGRHRRPHSSCVSCVVIRIGHRPD